MWEGDEEEQEIKTLFGGKMGNASLIGDRSGHAGQGGMKPPGGLDPEMTTPGHVINKVQGLKIRRESWKQ